MAKVTAADKKAILGLKDEPASPPEKFADINGALPICWQERKAVSFWRALLGDLYVSAVVDVTPGSGVLARACLLEGWPYLGIPRTAAHVSFMQNKLDRDALSVISKSGSAMYQADMAEHIKEHFADVLDPALGDDPEEEEEEEAAGDDESDGAC